jgi:hypothetical protein
MTTKKAKMSPAEYSVMKHKIEQAATKRSDTLHLHHWNNPEVVLDMLAVAEGMAIGPTGEKVLDGDPNDKGGLHAALVMEPDGALRVDFGTSLSFLRMRPHEAQAFAMGLLSKVGLPK